MARKQQLKPSCQEFCLFAEHNFPYILIWSLWGGGWELEKVFSVLFLPGVNCSEDFFQEPHLQTTVLSPENLPDSSHELCKGRALSEMPNSRKGLTELLVCSVLFWVPAQNGLAWEVLNDSGMANSLCSLAQRGYLQN